MSITIAFGAIVMLLLFPSCGGKEKKLGEAITERDSLPSIASLWTWLPISLIQE